MLAGSSAAAARARYRLLGGVWVTLNDMPSPQTHTGRLPSTRAPSRPGALHWSPDGRYLATLNDNMPSAVWVWDTSLACLAALLLHASPVRRLGWAPRGGGSGGARLAVAAGGARIYLWSPGGASVVHIPLAGFAPSGLHWAPGGGVLALTDKESFCCAYLAAGEEEEEAAAAGLG